MPGRKYQVTSTSKYRYSINGQEKESDLNENITTAQYWEYDSRIGRRWNVDPVFKANESPYAVFGNNPIRAVDPNGADSIFYNHAGKEIANLRIKVKGNDYFFVEHKDGNKNINGKSYFQGLTYESLFGDKSNPQKLFERIDYNWFKSNDFIAEQVDAYTPDLETKINFGKKSPEEKKYDFKNKLLTNVAQSNKHVAYMFQGILLNRNEAGNVYWGAAANKVGWNLALTLFLVNIYTLKDELSFDEPAEQYAIRWGWRYFEYWRENTVKGKAALKRQNAALSSEAEAESIKTMEREQGMRHKE